MTERAGETCSVVRSWVRRAVALAVLGALQTAIAAGAPRLIPEDIFARARTVWRERTTPANVTFIGIVTVVQDGHTGVQCAQRVELRTSDDRGSTDNAVAGEPACSVPNVTDELLYGPDDSPLGFYVSSRQYGAPSSQALARDPFGDDLTPDERLPIVANVKAVARDYRVTLVGIEHFDGRDAYHLALEPVSDPSMYPLRALWVDATSFQTLHLTYAAYWNHDTVDYYFAPAGADAVWYIDRIVTHERRVCSFFKRCSIDTTEQLRDIAFPAASATLPLRERNRSATAIRRRRRCPDCGGVLKHLGEDVSEMLDRIGVLYTIEKASAGRPPDEHRTVRQERSRPLLDVVNAPARSAFAIALAEIQHGKSAGAHMSLPALGAHFQNLAPVVTSR